MNVVYSDEQTRKDTGVIAKVYPFDLGMKTFSIVVRKDTVDVDGCACFGAEHARIFAEALNVAADVAEGVYHENQAKNTTKAQSST